MNFNYIEEKIAFEGGSVIIAGSGPGAVELLTYKVYGAIKTADVIIYDALVNPNILDFARKNCKLIFAGKTSNKKACSQSDINKWMIEFCKKKNKVLRLKGGDSSFFSRVSQETKFLSKHKISFKVFSGITAAQESVKSLGISFFNDSNICNFITGHRKIQNKSIEVNYEMFCKNKGKIIIYMGIGQISTVKRNLIKFGKHLNSKVFIITNASLKNEKKYVTILKDAPDFFLEHKIKPPGIIVIE